MFDYKNIRKVTIVYFLFTFCFSQMFNFPSPFNSAGNTPDDNEVQDLINKFTKSDSNIENPNDTIAAPARQDFLNTQNLTNTQNLKSQLKQVIVKEEKKIGEINNIKDELPLEDRLLIDKKTLDVVTKKRSDELKNALNKEENEKGFFGYNIFSKTEMSNFVDPYESIDPSYVIGPGDEIIIMLWGETELFKSFYISKEGFVFIPNIGQVFVNGLTLDKLEKKLFKLLKKSYNSLDPQSGGAKTFFDLSLGSSSLRPLRITLLGEVENSGLNYLKSSLSFFNSLFYFGGPSTSGSLRNVKLIRNDKEISTIDLYNYIMTGKKGKDIRLQRDDVIFFPLKAKSVFVRGEIKRSSMHFELKDEEGLKQLIRYAGGIKPRTFLKRIQIQRRLSPEKRSALGFNTTLIDVDISNIFETDYSIDLYDGDEITFLSVDDIVKNIVTISGPLLRPGSYSIGKKLFISDLIEKAGIKENTYLKRVDIYRKNKDLTEDLITFNLTDVLNGIKSKDLELRDSDKIILYDKLNMMDEENVEIVGFVKSPGLKKFRSGMTISDLIFLGGGFETQSHLDLAYLDRAELIRYNEKDFSKKIIPFRLDSAISGNIFSKKLLKNRDKIKIYSISEVNGEANKVVTISGFVKRPGTYPLFDENMTIYDLLFNAGGIDDTLHVSRTFLDRADLIRYDNDFKTTKITRYNLGDVIKNDNENYNCKMRARDKVIVYSTDDFNTKRLVNIDGIVKRPGSYELSENSSLKDLILDAGGVNLNVYKYKAEIARIDPNSKSEDIYANIITVELDNDFSIFSNSEKPDKFSSNQNLSLQKYDLITLRPDPRFSMQRKVTISGEVYYPGDYVITSPYEKVSDIIERAGGLRPGGYPDASSLLRNGNLILISFDKIIKYPNSKYNFEVSSGDVLNIGKRSKLVIVNGEVNSPGNYQYIKGFRFKDYVSLAGGYTKDGSKNQSFVSYPNGSSKKVSFIKRSPFIIDGTVIEVGKKAGLEIDINSYLNNLTNTIAQVSQTILLISILKSNL